MIVKWASFLKPIDADPEQPLGAEGAAGCRSIPMSSSIPRSTSQCRQANVDEPRSTSQGRQAKVDKIVNATQVSHGGEVPCDAADRGGAI